MDKVGVDVYAKYATDLLLADASAEVRDSIYNTLKCSLLYKNKVMFLDWYKGLPNCDEAMLECAKSMACFIEVVLYIIFSQITVSWRDGLFIPLSLIFDKGVEAQADMTLTSLLKSLESMSDAIKTLKTELSACENRLLASMAMLNGSLKEKNPVVDALKEKVATSGKRERSDNE